MSSDRDTATRDAIRALSTQLDAAAARTPTIARRYRIAGAAVTIHSTRESAVGNLLTAFEPLREADGPASRETGGSASRETGAQASRNSVNPTRHVQPADDARALDVYIWDAAVDAVALPDSPVLRRENTNPEGLGGFSDAISNAFYQPEAGVLSILDIARRRAHWWLRDAASAPYYERAAPCKHILQWWVASSGGALLHSAAIAAQADGDDRGVLISGPSGSGKSSTALACLAEGFGFASDDYVIVGGGEPPVVHLAYSTAKVLRADLGRFGGYAPHFRNLARDDEKPMMFVHEFAPQSIRTSLRPVALVMPHVAHATRTHFVPISPATMLRALAPSSMLLFPLAGARPFARMAELCRSLPCWRAELADDARDVARAFGELLAPTTASRASEVA